jgi:hypothetical protein
VLKGHGPAIDADRQYGSPGGGREVATEAEEEDLPELVVDLTWLDVAEEVTSDVQMGIDRVEAGDHFVEFAVLEEDE